MEMNITQVAMLHRLKISQWGASKKDQQESREVCEKNHAQDGAANVFVQLVPKDELKPIQKAKSKIRNIWLRYTLPWLDDGVRILPAKCYERFTNEMREAVESFDKEVEKFLMRYPQIVENSPPNLGELLKNNPLPSVDELRYKFSIQQNIQPLPKASDFQVNLFRDEPLAEIRRNITNSVNDATKEAVNSLYEELYKLVGKIKDTMSLKDKIFRDSLIENLRDFCKMLPDLNITNDERLNQLCRECNEQLGKVEPQNLRDSKRLRQVTADKAKTMLENIRKIDLDIE